MTGQQLKVEEMGDPGADLSEGVRRALFTLADLGRADTSNLTSKTAGTINGRAFMAMSQRELAEGYIDDDSGCRFVRLTGKGVALAAAMRGG